MTTMTLTPTDTKALMIAQVLGVYWMHDDVAQEQGYALHYRTETNATGITLLADERSERDAPLYLADWVRLRPVGTRRHTLVEILTQQRPADAVAVDWVAVCLSPPVAPAQLGATTEPTRRCPITEAVHRLETEREQRLASKYPDVAAFLAQLDQPGRMPRALADRAFRQACTNGGW